MRNGLLFLNAVSVIGHVGIPTAVIQTLIITAPTAVQERMVAIMAEYIEREAAIKLIASDKTEISPLLCALVPTYTAEQAFEGLNQSCDRHIKFINSIPSADVQLVKHGRWIPSEDDSKVFGCSECYEIVYGTPNFCPNCGALMGDEDDV